VNKFAQNLGLGLLLGICTDVFAHGDDLSPAPVAPVVDDTAETLPTIRVEDMRERLERAGKLKDTIMKTEVINDKKIERKQAKTLTEAVANEPGIDAATGCSICGMKRIQINGLRGEYTTILVDDVPIHSTVSSYYGMDALTTAGIARVEVARGAGASLLAPGALGGVINIVSQKAIENGLTFDLAGGNRDYRVFSLVGNSVSKSGTRRTTVSAQHNHQGQWDADNNGVNESPRMDNYTLGLRISEDFTPSDNVDFRLSIQKSDVFGGPIADYVFPSIIPTGAVAFDGDDVRKRYTGAPGATMEQVNTGRLEGTTKWTHRFGENTNGTVTASAVKQTQDSFYETKDYANFNETFYADARLNHSLSDAWLFTVGSDARHEILRSTTHAYSLLPGYRSDDFDFMAGGAYAQFTWTPNSSFEVAAATRLDHLTVNWRGQTAQENEIDQFVLVPRVHMRWIMSPLFTSRLSIGQGYRAPLTFFESEHGILDEGYDVNVTGIERSNSAVYSLSFDNERTTSTLSAAWTNISNLAYVNMHTGGKPRLENDPGRYDVFATDAVVGYQISKAMTLGASYEHFFYSAGYKSLMPFASIEDRARFMVDVESGPIDFNLTATLVGARDLLPYKYGDRYNVYSGGVASSPKLTNAPAFVTVDSKISWQFSKDFKVYGGVKNILDFTQAKVENALFFEPNGNYDVIHLWGPLRGREIYLGVSAKL
jgi:outer membrane receptor for ferrienterochelin and colicins